MADDYTPTTEEVHEAISEWVWSRRMFRPELGQSDGREADRWLAEHDRQVAERAWDEGHLIHGEDYRHTHQCREASGCLAENPHRAKKERA